MRTEITTAGKCITVPSDYDLVSDDIVTLVFYAHNNSIQADEVYYNGVLICKI